MQVATLLITSTPFSSIKHELAMRFIRAWYHEGHSVRAVFFYADACLVANKSIQPPQGQTALFEQWLALAKPLNIPLRVCIANAIRRGILDESEAARYQKVETLADGFELVGLGELASITDTTERLIRF